MNIGVFGGTFDPPHIGHLIAAQDAFEALSLDRLLFIPAAQPPHKATMRISPAEIRLEMLRAAVGDNPDFEISTLELERKGASYTVDTLRELKARFSGATLFLLLGVDQIREFSSWREPDRIRSLAHVAMLARAGAEVGEADFVYDVVPVTRVDVSSTLVRERIARGASCRYLVPDGVAEVIEREQLYRELASVQDQR